MAEELRPEEPAGATPLQDTEGLRLVSVTSREELFRAEFANITQASRKYFLKKPSRREAPFSYAWLLKLHQEMFGDVWEWAGKLRRENLSVGVDWPQMGEELGRFLGDLKAWLKHKHDLVEISAKIHHRLVWIHPFKNGNGRWARVAANIFLWQRDLPLVRWPEDELFIQAQFRGQYIRVLRKADQGEFSDLIDLHRRLLYIVPQ